MSIPLLISIQIIQRTLKIKSKHFLISFFPSLSLSQDQYQALRESIGIGETTRLDRRVYAYQNFHTSSQLAICIHLHITKSTSTRSILSKSRK